MIKILIVDDEKPICDLIDLNLSAAGYFCKSVQDGMKAIELIEKETFDLILLDIMLPGRFCTRRTSWKQITAIWEKCGSR